MQLSTSMNKSSTSVKRRSFTSVPCHIQSSLTEETENCVACSLIQSRLNYAKNSLHTGMLSTNFSTDLKCARARSYIIEKDKPYFTYLYVASLTDRICSNLKPSGPIIKVV